MSTMNKNNMIKEGKHKLTKIELNYNSRSRPANIIAIVPFYDETGCNSTIIYLKDNRYGIIKNKTSTVVENIARIYTHSLESIRNKYKGVINKTIGIPLPLNPYLVLVPLKVRKPYGENDGATGYFCELAIENYIKFDDNGKNHTKLIFESGLELPVMQSLKSVDSAMDYANIVKKLYLESLSINPDALIKNHP